MGQQARFHAVLEVGRVAAIDANHNHGLHRPAVGPVIEAEVSLSQSVCPVPGLHMVNLRMRAEARSMRDTKAMMINSRADVSA